MKAYRLSKGVTEHYTSFEELRAAFGLAPVTKQTKNKNKLQEQFTYLLMNLQALLMLQIEQANH